MSNEPVFTAEATLKLDKLKGLFYDMEKAIQQSMNEIGKAGIASVQHNQSFKGSKLRSAEFFDVIGNSIILDNKKHYAKYVNNGRPIVRAKKGKYLRFVINGEVFFRKKVKATKPTHFQEKALQDMKSAAIQIITAKLNALGAK